MAEFRGQGALSRVVNAAWVRPFLFLIFIIVAWDVTIRLIKIPPYQNTAPADVVVVQWNPWPEQLRQTMP
ncbi:MAG: ABC transporter permease, partial [Bradyrhizobium sp.]